MNEKIVAQGLSDLGELIGERKRVFSCILEELGLRLVQVITRFM